jgi:hypothetical protein
MSSDDADKDDLIKRLAELCAKQRSDINSLKYKLNLISGIVASEISTQREGTIKDREDE